MDYEKKAKDVIAEIVGVDASTLTPETELVADLGVDSAKALHLIIKLEDELGIEVGDEEVAEMQTVGKILEFISRHRAAAGA